MNTTEPRPASPDPLMCVLSYLGLLALIPLLARKDDPFVQWHAKQGLLLMAASIGVMIALGVIGVALPWAVAGLLGMAVWLGVLTLMVVCIVQAVRGERWPIPVIGSLVSRVPNAA
ncbi:MAG: DUF4870 domain-containing protein [Planctomycetota bacterium]